MSRASLWLTSLTLLACSGEPVTRALEEPIRIPDAQFFEGELPGLPPLTADEINAGVMPKTPFVSGINLGNAVIPPRESGRAISGLSSPDTQAVGVRFEELGTGYWLLPTRGADVVNDGALGWSFRASFGGGLPTGLQKLLLAGIDAEGHSGNQVALTLCLSSELPDNGNSCDPSTAPPALVVSLAWQAAVDLDLRVVTPTGKIVDSKNPTTANEDEDGKIDTTLPGVGVIPFDSFARCAPDGRRRESLVFQETPPAGTYLIYANLYDACGQSGVSFDVSMHTLADGEEPDTYTQTQTYEQAGQLQAVHANGGAGLGMFIASFNVK
ncbi:MAG TPA: hypothetical protein VHP33_15905 [Polyangiaceae bacterium]|nr:hypothetical protein [Polyangiaceae bacterium]